MARKPTFTLVIVALLVLGMLVNWGLSYYIESMKERNFALIPEELRGNCFEGAEGGAGCGAVQTSTYSSTFGISNPYYGYVAFPVLALLIGASYWAVQQKHRMRKYVVQGTFVGLLIGSGFSIWLLYVQFMLLRTTCIYCLWVDAIMLAVTAGFAWLFRRELA